MAAGGWTESVAWAGLPIRWGALPRSHMARWRNTQTQAWEKPPT